MRGVPPLNLFPPGPFPSPDTSWPAGTPFPSFSGVTREFLSDFEPLALLHYFETRTCLLGRATGIKNKIGNLALEWENTPPEDSS